MPQCPYATRDTVIRMALACMAADITSSLTCEQRVWIIALASRTTALTPADRAKLHGPLSAWILDRMPLCAEIIERQFSVED